MGKGRDLYAELQSTRKYTRTLMAMTRNYQANVSGIHSVMEG